jgi:diadenylate cyclase
MHYCVIVFLLIIFISLRFILILMNDKLGYSKTNIELVFNLYLNRDIIYLYVFWWCIILVIDVLLYILSFYFLFLIIYFTLKIFTFSTRIGNIFKGMLYLLVIFLVSQYLNLELVNRIFEPFIEYWPILLIVIFSPEIRIIFERIGRNYTTRTVYSVEKVEKEYIIEELIKTSEYLSKRRIGALIALERNESLEDFIKEATPYHIRVSSEVLTTIFIPSTPVHDGAVIIRGEHIMCARAVLPNCKNEEKLPPKVGTRHRAALGLSEQTDALVIVVSEETGNISIALNGKIDYGITKESLRLYIDKHIMTKSKKKVIDDGE